MYAVSCTVGSCASMYLLTSDKLEISDQGGSVTVTVLENALQIPLRFYPTNVQLLV